MIRQLKRKFIFYAFGSIFAFLVLILGLVNIINFATVAKEADDTTALILDNGGVFPEGDPSQTPPSEGEMPIGGPGRREAEFDTRFFTVTFSETGEIIATNTSRISLSDNEANALAKEVLLKKKGWYGSYRYLVQNSQNPGITDVIFVDYTRELAPSFTVLWTSLGVFGGGLIITAITVIFVGKWVVKPVEEANRKQKQFLADASHALKTPITIISANTELLEMEMGEQNESVQAIERQTNRLSQTVKDLNHIVRLDEEKPEGFIEVSLTEIADELVSSFSRSFQKEGKALRASIADDVFLNGQEKMLRDMLENLLSNALKYAESYCEFSMKKDGDRISIVLRNDAEVPDGDLSLYFNRFYRSPEANGSGKEGSGLGLAIVKDIVELHRGRVYASGKGNVFTIEVNF